MTERRAAEGRATISATDDDTANKQTDFFKNEFSKETPAPSTGRAKTMSPATETALQKSKLYNYRLKFNNEYLISGVSNNILINRYQPYAGGTGPIRLGNGSNINFTFRASVADLMEDIKFVGGFRLGTNLRDNDYLFGFQNLRRRFDWGLTYYRTSDHNVNLTDLGGNAYAAQLNTSLYQFNGSYPLNEVKSFRVTAAYRRDNFVVKPIVNGDPSSIALEFEDIPTLYALTRFEFVHDNTLNPSQNIWIGLRWKAYMDINAPIKDKTRGGSKYTYNFGFDARKYVPIYRNFIWAGRAAADVSWGTRKLIYYLGGVDGWLNPKFNNLNRPLDQDYAFQTLAVNMRGFQQNIANGNNAIVFNSEFRLPVFSTLINKPINNAFLRNFQLVQFADLGTAWNGKYNKLARPSAVFSSDDPINPITFRKKAGGIGPFAGGYGFGARSTLLGYFLKVDAAWQMDGIFKGKPVWYFALGFDF
jgi:hypothetical protein